MYRLALIRTTEEYGRFSLQYTKKLFNKIPDFYFFDNIHIISTNSAVCQKTTAVFRKRIRQTKAASISSKIFIDAKWEGNNEEKLFWEVLGEIKKAGDNSEMVVVILDDDRVLQHIHAVYALLEIPEKQRIWVPYRLINEAINKT